MKFILIWMGCLLLVLTVFNSCKKEYSCEDCLPSAPIANAGTDQTIILPADTVRLDGSGSTDPDNDIVGYEWTKTSGPASFFITHKEGVQTSVTKLTEGVYLFELKVTDAGGLIGKDTVQIIVNKQDSVDNAPGNATCGDSNRSIINAQLLPVGNLSKGRVGMAVASAGNKIVFAGGNQDADCNFCWGSTIVDIYDISTSTWSTAKLSAGRWGITAVAAGDKIFFAGGERGDGAFDTCYATVDIYDVTTDTWTVDSLSQPRSFAASAVVGNKVIFAGGQKDWEYQCSATVDIYDLATSTWSTAKLSAPRSSITAVTVNQKVYFAGGSGEDRWYKKPSSTIDIYDNASNSWSTTFLMEPKEFFAGIAVANKIYWAGGVKDGNYTASCAVEIKDVNTGTSSVAYLSTPATFKNSNGDNAVLKDNKIVFFRNTDWPNQTNVTYDKFDIYNMATNTWSIGVLPANITRESSIIAVNNVIYIAGGFLNDKVTSLVNKLEF